MKKFLLIIILVFCLILHLNALETKYESKKKNVATGILLSTLLPGCGLNYANADVDAFLFTTFEIGLLTWGAFETIKTDKVVNNSIVPFGMFFALKTAEYIDVFYKIRTHNKNVLGKSVLKPQMDFFNDKINLSLVYKF